MPIFAKIVTANFEKIGVKLFWGGFIVRSIAPSRLQIERRFFGRL